MMSTGEYATRPLATRTLTKLNSNQIKGFWAAWAGWTLDGMDAFIYALVLVPALTELLPRSGLTVTAGNIGYYGSILQALFLLGWGLSMVWGPIADRFGRVRDGSRTHFNRLVISPTSNRSAPRKMRLHTTSAACNKSRNNATSICQQNLSPLAADCRAAGVLKCRA